MHPLAPLPQNSQKINGKDNKKDALRKRGRASKQRGSKQAKAGLGLRKEDDGGRGGGHDTKLW